jgi:hypothetical protein
MSCVLGGYQGFGGTYEYHHHLHCISKIFLEASKIVSDSSSHRDFVIFNTELEI